MAMHEQRPTPHPPPCVVVLFGATKKHQEEAPSNQQLHEGLACCVQGAGDWHPRYPRRVVRATVPLSGVVERGGSQTTPSAGEEEGHTTGERTRAGW